MAFFVFATPSSLDMVFGVPHQFGELEFFPVGRAVATAGPGRCESGSQSHRSCLPGLDRPPWFFKVPAARSDFHSLSLSPAPSHCVLGRRTEAPGRRRFSPQRACCPLGLAAWSRQGLVSTWTCTWGPGCCGPRRQPGRAGSRASVRRWWCGAARVCLLPPDRLVACLCGCFWSL